MSRDQYRFAKKVAKNIVGFIGLIYLVKRSVEQGAQAVYPKQ